MPVYEYECAHCHFRAEISQGMNDPDPQCPVCYRDPMDKKISKTSFTLKGSGWSKDGYGGK